MQASKRPNIVLIMTDQHRADYLGCYGHKVLQTPHIDSIASQGVRLDRFYVASPVCMPNRASLMTGRMPSVHGVRMNGISLSFENVTFAEALKDSGYRTAMIGKSHLQNFTGSNPTMKRSYRFPEHRKLSKALDEAKRNHLDSERYRQEDPTRWTEDFSVEKPYYGFEHVELAPAHGDALAGDHKLWVLQQEPNALSLIGAENQLSHDYICPQAVRTALPPELYSTNYVAERSVAYLRKQKSVNGEQPFFLKVSFPDPHHPFNPPGHYWDMYKPEEMEVPASFRDQHWTPPPHIQSLIEERESDQANLKGMTAIACNEREALEARALTCGMISCVDDAVGRILGALKESGLDESTVVIFTADHGEHLGDHGLLFKGAAHYQSILRVPFIWRDPDVERKGVKVSDVASTIDIATTILDRAGVEPFNGIQGKSLMQAIHGEVSDEESSALIQYEHQKYDSALNGTPKIHTLVTDRWRITLLLDQSWGELYDLRNDPNELHNRWDDNEVKSVKWALIERLLRKELDYIEKSPLPAARA